MTVHSDLEKAIAMASAAKGNYLLFATDSEDDKATQVFQQMADDMDRHVTILDSRLNYLSQHNNLIKQSANGGNNQANANGNTNANANGNPNANANANANGNPNANGKAQGVMAGAGGAMGGGGKNKQDGGQSGGK